MTATQNRAKRHCTKQRLVNWFWQFVAGGHWKGEGGKCPDRFNQLLGQLNQLRPRWLRSQFVEPLSPWRGWQHNRQPGRPPFAPRKDPAAQPCKLEEQVQP